MGLFFGKQLIHFNFNYSNVIIFFSNKVAGSRLLPLFFINLLLSDLTYIY